MLNKINTSKKNNLYNYWKILKNNVLNCKLCNLHNKKKNIVFGYGNINSTWLFIGEAPGYLEDKYGQPFIGKSGKLLENILYSINLNRNINAYITNIIKCRPPNNRNPYYSEIFTCSKYLKKQIILLKPKIIVTLGKFAMQFFTKQILKITLYRGYVYKYKNIPVIFTYHPAYLLRNPKYKKDIWKDLCLAKKIYNKIYKNKKIK